MVRLPAAPTSAVGAIGLMTLSRRLAGNPGSNPHRAGDQGDTTLRLQLQSQLLLQCRKEACAIRVQRRQRRCARCLRLVGRPVKVDVKATRKACSVFDETVVISPATHQTRDGLYRHRCPVALPGIFL